MNTVLKEKVSGLSDEIKDYLEAFKDLDLLSKKDELAQLLQETMLKLGYDKVTVDDVGNVIGCIKGYSHREDMVILANIDLIPNAGNQDRQTDLIYRQTRSLTEINKVALITSLLSGALLKRSIAALTGDLYVCCVPRFECCGYGVQYLFDNTLQNKTIKGVLLSEPTDFDINVGNKGRMEYQINIKGSSTDSLLADSNLLIMNSMYPLISRLEEARVNLPHDKELGQSNLSIKDISFSKKGEIFADNLMSVTVDRTYLATENSPDIINKAKAIAASVYKEPHISVSTQINKGLTTTNKGQDMYTPKEYKPWKMESHNSFVLNALQVLQENSFSSQIDHWKSIVTEGSYTCGQLNLPTIGFGAGTEKDLNQKISLPDIQRSILGKSLIVYRSIGMPTFGWSSDDI